MAKKNPYLNDRDILDQALEHSWGKTADAKAKEKAYNREYYQRHKEEILRKARQAGEGIQRTAQNAANAIDREARAISDTIMRPNYERRPQELSTWRYDYPDTGFRGQGIKNSWALERDKEDRNRTRDALKFPTAERNRARNEQRAYNAEQQLRKSANWRSANAAARNERSKKANTLMPESRFDSKLVRDAQNAYSKVRPGLRKAKNAAEDAINTAKNNAQAYIDNAMGKNGRRGSNIDTRQLEIDARKAQSKRNRINNAQQKAEKRADARWEQYQGLRQINPNSQFTKDADHAYTQAITQATQLKHPAKKSRQQASASAAAYNAASNAANRPGYDTRYDSSIVRGVQNTKAKARGAMSKAEKAAQQAREDAKKRMKKWFGHSDYGYKKNELYHHGIKDQKWGVRRFQYEDGSLTPAGRERYSNDTGSNTARVELPNGGTLKRSNGVWQHITNNPFDEYSQVSNSYAIGQLFKALASNYGTGTSRVDLSNGGTLKNVNGQWKYISDNPLDEYRDISEDYATTLMMKEYKQRT